MRFVRRPLALVLIALLVTGCSHAVPIPRAEWSPEPAVAPGAYRVRLHGRVEYLVRHYAITDSTVVINELMPSDERFPHGRESLPIAIPLARVESISRMEPDWPMTSLAVVGLLGLVAFMILLMTVELPTS
jgi:hypothetical protein